MVETRGVDKKRSATATPRQQDKQRRRQVDKGKRKMREAVTPPSKKLRLTFVGAGGGLSDSEEERSPHMPSGPGGPSRPLLRSMPVLNLQHVIPREMVPTRHAEPAVGVRGRPLVEESWEEHLDALRAWVTRHRSMPRQQVLGEEGRLASWASKQRAHGRALLASGLRRGRGMTRRRMELLEAEVPGWTWGNSGWLREEQYQANLDQLEGFLDRHGALPSTGSHLGRWAKRERKALQKGALRPAWRARALQLVLARVGAV